VRRVVGWFVVYVVVLGAIDVYRWQIWSFGGDAGLFAQAALDAFGGFRDGPEQASHFAYHWSPVLALLYPVVALWRSALALQLVQLGLVGASVFPFYALLRRATSEALASRIALLALLYPPLIGVAFADFHELAFFPLTLFALVWAADAQRWLACAAFGFVAVLIREDVALVVAGFGAALAIAGALRRGRPGAGLLWLAPVAPAATMVAGAGLIALSAAAFGAYFALVVPALGGWRPSHFYTYPFADGPLALAAALLVQPWTVLAAVATLGRLTFLLEALVPLLLLPLRSTWMLVALPGLLVILLSSESAVWRMGNHYVALVAPQLLLGTAAVLVALARERPAAAQRRLSIVFGLCALVLVAFNPLHLAHYLTPPYADLADVRRAFALVPRDAVVSTHDEWFTHYALSYPNVASSGVFPTSYAVFADDYTYPWFRQSVLPRLRAAVAQGRFRVLAQYGNVKVYVRTTAR